MSRDITIIIPGEPCAKGRPRIGRMANGRPVAITPEKTRTREGIIASAAMDAMGDAPPMEGPVAMMVTAIMEIPKSWSKKAIAAAETGFTAPTKKPDADNILKLIGDSLNGIVFRDDSQVVSATVSKAWGRIPKTIVTIGPYVRPGIQIALEQAA